MLSDPIFRVIFHFAPCCLLDSLDTLFELPKIGFNLTRTHLLNVLIHIDLFIKDGVAVLFPDLLDQIKACVRCIIAGGHFLHVFNAV